MDRRSFLLLGAGASAGAAVLGVRFFGDSDPAPVAAPDSTTGRTAASTTEPTAAPPTSYSELQAPDPNGMQLPRGFSARVVATSGSVVAGTSYSWHVAPDGGACFLHRDGGWAYVSNSETVLGGASALRFDGDGTLVDAYRILAGTVANCAGGATPWGTWLSCEEIPQGRVWECDPFGADEAIVRPALGEFTHEAATCDPTGKQVYLTEDTREGKLRRFRPRTWGDLSAGTLEAAVVDGNEVSWTTDIDRGSAFDGGEGLWYADGKVWFTTKGDGRVWELDVRATPNTIRVIYDDDASPSPVLTNVDNITGSTSGDLFVAEDGGNLELVLIEPSGAVSPFMRLLDQPGSEITGPAFSPDGSRLYFSSQRGPHEGGSGITYEVTGPFRT